MLFIVLCIILMIICVPLALGLFYLPYIAGGVALTVIIYAVIYIQNKRKIRNFYKRCVDEGVKNLGDEKIKVIGEYYKIQKPYEVFQQMYTKEHPDEYPEVAEKIRIQQEEMKRVRKELMWYGIAAIVGAAICFGIYLLYRQSVTYLTDDGFIMGTVIFLGLLLGFLGRKGWKAFRSSSKAKQDAQKELDEKLKQMNKKKDDQ